MSAGGVGRVSGTWPVARWVHFSRVEPQAARSVRGLTKHCRIRASMSKQYRACDGCWWTCALFWSGPYAAWLPGYLHEGILPCRALQRCPKRQCAPSGMIGSMNSTTDLEHAPDPDPNSPTHPTHVDHDHPDPLATRTGQPLLKPRPQLPRRFRPPPTRRHWHIFPPEPQHDQYPEAGELAGGPAHLTPSWSPTTLQSRRS